MIQGQSFITEEKARGFTSVFRQQLSVVKYSQNPVIANSIYVHIDLHAGSGFNSEVGVIGSPVLFESTAHNLEFERYVLLCVEKDKHRIAELGSRLQKNDRAFPHWGDNGELCECVPDILRGHNIEPSNAVGSVLIDPNGFVDQIPWRQLDELFKRCGRIDVVFNFPGTAYTRNRAHSDHVDISELPKRMSKAHWFIREPLPTHKFTLCVGRNTDLLRIPEKLGSPFARWESDKGSQYRNKAMMTSDELAALPLRGQREFSFG